MQNPFASWTQVFFKYCSSDVWSGQNSYALQQSADGGPAYGLVFRGHTIFERAIARLRTGVTSDDGAFTLPSLQGATGVVLAGASAGSVGAQQHADWLREELDAGVPFRAVFDAIIQIPFDDFPDAGLADEHEAYVRTTAGWMLSDAGWKPFLDRSCLAAHDAGSNWQCLDTAHVLQNHVTSAMLARADLSDPGQIDKNPLGLDAGAFATLQRATLLRLRAAPVYSEEAAALMARPAVYGLNCGTHTALLNSAQLVAHQVSDENGTAWSMGRALITWVSDGGFGAAVDNLQSPTSVCP